jgi:hypothetical protein
MRIWSIHPKYLDTKGLVASWREALLAKNVLLGKTKGYVNHPQLNRFKEIKDSINYINLYLNSLYEEALNRNYKFNKSKIGRFKKPRKFIFVNDGQLDYEFKHLQKKLRIRDKNKFKENEKIKQLEVNPIFKTKKGDIEDWERISENKVLDFISFIKE